MGCWPFLQQSEIKKMKKHTFIIKEGQKGIGKAEAGDKVLLTKKQAIAFRDKLQLTPEQRVQMDEDAIPAGFRVPNANAIPPRQTLVASPPVEGEMPPEGEPGGEDDLKLGDSGNESGVSSPPTGPPVGATNPTGPPT